MEIVLHVEAKNLSKVKEVLGKDDLVSRASMTWRSGSVIGKSDYFCLLSGSDEQCRRAVEIVKEIAKEADKPDAEAFAAKIREEEEAAGAGLGGIFG